MKTIAKALSAGLYWCANNMLTVWISLIIVAILFELISVFAGFAIAFFIVLLYIEDHCRAIRAKI